MLAIAASAIDDPPPRIDAMRRFSHLTGHALLTLLDTLNADERGTTASVLACIAEIDDRKLYLDAGYPSMHAYCVERLGYSKDRAFKRIRAARASHRCPALIEALASGRLNLTTLNLLGPYLTEGNADELITAAGHQRSEDVEALLAARFPQPEFLGVGEITPVPEASLQQAARPVGARNSLPMQDPSAPPEQRTRVIPVAAERYLLHVPIARSTQQKLEHAQELLSHAVPSADVAQVLDRALDSLIEKLEKRKCARTENPRPRRSRSTDPRHIPAHVRRAVWERDGGQCTFVGDGGHRCGSRTRLELDHIVPVARGGEATVANLRLHCRAHNQYEAERVFGAECMRGKRAVATRGSETRHAAAESPVAPVAGPLAAADDAAAQLHRDLEFALCEFGYRREEIRQAIAFAEREGAASIEAALRAALRFLTPRPRAPRSDRALSP